MKVGYTEFSFGYAFTENLIRSSLAAPVGAPAFPNLIEEGEYGFDVNINFPGVPLFFQYKLPELMRRNTAYEIAKWHCAGLSVPFFRISMMRRDISRQHELLMRLESVYPAGVFYAAPCIASVQEFDRAYNSAVVAQRSVLFSPSDIGRLPDDKAHSIAYRSGLAMGYFCSEPKEIQARAVDDLTNVVSSRFKEHRFDTIENSAREMRESVVKLASAPMRQAEQLVAERVRATRLRVREGLARSPQEEQAVIDFLVAREIARVDFGVDALIAQPG